MYCVNLERLVCRIVRTKAVCSVCQTASSWPALQRRSMWPRVSSIRESIFSAASSTEGWQPSAPQERLSAAERAGPSQPTACAPPARPAAMPARSGWLLCAAISSALMPSSSKMSSPSPASLSPSSSMCTPGWSTMSSHLISTSSAMRWSTTASSTPSRTPSPAGPSASANSAERYAACACRSRSLCGSPPTSMPSSRPGAVGTSPSSRSRPATTSRCTHASAGAIDQGPASGPAGGAGGSPRSAGAQAGRVGSGSPRDRSTRRVGSSST
mmetsp:Transcript_47963/g.121034  ORF Transcript_47963/g.121034 Transcript_47963/m.121034 type:complete len:270 (-) Transcript_47963:747-1556(-)